ncbi:hypothetical protein HN481_00580 [Candidatus Parcubacteria bacterium]|nr:hypothetical protein [Candidatus Parcubacteria bacterium]
MNNKKNFSFLLGILVALIGVVFLVSTVSAADPKSTTYGLKTTAGAAGLNTGDVPTIVGNIIGSALSLISVLFFILMVYGGIVWMLARGKEEQSKKALDTIIGAIIGIIIVLAAYAITNFVFSSVGNVGGGGGPTSPSPDSPAAVTGFCGEENTAQCGDIDNQTDCTDYGSGCVWGSNNACLEQGTDQCGDIDNQTDCTDYGSGCVWAQVSSELGNEGTVPVGDICTSDSDCVDGGGANVCYVDICTAVMCSSDGDCGLNKECNGVVCAFEDGKCGVTDDCVDAVVGYQCVNNNCIIPVGEPYSDCFDVYDCNGDLICLNNVCANDPS